MMAILDLCLYTNNIRKTTTCRALFLPDYGSWKDRTTTSKDMGGHGRHILLVRQILTSMMRKEICTGQIYSSFINIKCNVLIDVTTISTNYTGWFCATSNKVDFVWVCYLHLKNEGVPTITLRNANIKSRWKMGIRR